MKVISEEKLAEIIVYLNNHQILKARKELYALEDLPEKKEEPKVSI
jgi:hypothetical protein